MKIIREELVLISRTVVKVIVIENPDRTHVYFKQGENGEITQISIFDYQGFTDAFYDKYYRQPKIKNIKYVK